MPRPEPRIITFQIDGREVSAPENAMIVDAAKHGDVEIPVFCYEPKLGQPVGACRMCLVEIEGMPKLQTGCSTPVKDGMVVHTQSAKVRAAQEAVVEFLLVNHPLDCPVCDKGGECPLQDITFGWGGGRSRFIEPKRHFKKPLELSPLVAIDRERCILCYRCVRYSQEVAEDHQLVLHERGGNSFVGTFDGHPYVAPFSGNIVDLCPVGALTSTPYRFRARPWDVESAGSVCTMCPSQCNVTLTVRDERVLRVLARDNGEVEDGWLCDKGRFAYQSLHSDERVVAPMVRDGGVLRPVSWDRALAAAATALGRAKGRVGALAGGGATNEEGFLLGRLMREALGSPHLDSRRASSLSIARQRALHAPAIGARVSDIEHAHAVLVLDCEPLHEAPILDLRIRKGVRRNGVRLAVASERPSSLDGGAELSLRFDPGAGWAFVVALEAALAGAEHSEAARAAGADPVAVEELAALLRGAGEDIVIIWGERLTDGPDGDEAARALLRVATALELERSSGAGLLELPSTTNGRGLREAGVLPDGGAGLIDAPEEGLGAAGIAEALGSGELSALYLLGVDPLRGYPDRQAWEQALARSTTVVAHAAFLTEGIREHATVVFPSETYAEKDGTLVHPDGRVQRLRPAIAHQGENRPEWQVLAELCDRLGLDTGVRTGAMAFAALVDAVPFYDGLTLEELGGRGVRWADREAADGRYPSCEPATPSAAISPTSNGVRPADASGLRLGTYRPLWAAPEVEASPSLQFLIARQELEMAPADAARLGLEHGQPVEVSLANSGGAAGANGARPRVLAKLALRERVPAGTVFLQEATAEQDANDLTSAGSASRVEVRAQ